MAFKLIVGVLLTSIGVLVADDGSGEGRKGNELYKDGEFQLAEEQYKLGIASLEQQERGLVTHGLWNNLGASLFRQERYDEAAAAFIEASTYGPELVDQNRSSYNAGNAAFRDQKAEKALEYYRNAMLSDPDDTNAKFNYEFVLRQMQNDQNQDQQQDQEDQDQQNQDQQQDQDQDQEGEQDQQNQDQEQQDQDQDQEGEQDQQNQDQQDPQDQNNDGQQDQQDQQPDPRQLTKEQAEQILQALETDEKELLREVKKMKGRKRSVKKDW